MRIGRRCELWPSGHERGDWDDAWRLFAAVWEGRCPPGPMATDGEPIAIRDSDGTPFADSFPG
ncbi:MAG: hypothetical protein ACOCWL_02880, partial [Thermoguttaceae bacterium]